MGRIELCAIPDNYRFNFRSATCAFARYADDNRIFAAFSYTEKEDGLIDMISSGKQLLISHDYYGGIWDVRMDGELFMTIEKPHWFSEKFKLQIHQQHFIMTAKANKRVFIFKENGKTEELYGEIKAKQMDMAKFMYQVSIDDALGEELVAVCFWLRNLMMSRREQLAYS